MQDGEQNDDLRSQGMNVDTFTKDKKTLREFYIFLSCTLFRETFPTIQLTSFFSVVVAIKDLKIIEEKEEALMALGNLAYNIGYVRFKPRVPIDYEICAL